ncbi:hypothetical protein H6P81_021381 [Aristolochia fimbriata]|uniref:NADH:ubiquinone oxidoreductase-like 20kDa subunit domain-containing protein n=11 Tax=Aristolochia TaxID=12947 RepID=A0AAV7DSM8_ARIFI|nr:hypothetical protein H6P81_021381 [Aristolochia fimbriata]
MFRSASMFLLHEYDIFWAFLIISSVIPILAFLISGVLAPISEGPEKLSSYESGGMFSTDSYSTVRGVDKLIPVDVYLPGCPPKPEAIMDAITKLRKKVSREIYEDRIGSQQENRYFTTNHKFHVEQSTHTGNYDQGLLYQSPSTSEIPSETFFKKQKFSIFPRICELGKAGCFCAVQDNKQRVNLHKFHRQFEILIRMWERSRRCRVVYPLG